MRVSVASKAAPRLNLAERRGERALLLAQQPLRTAHDAPLGANLGELCAVALVHRRLAAQLGRVLAEFVALEHGPIAHLGEVARLLGELRLNAGALAPHRRQPLRDRLSLLRHKRRLLPEHGQLVVGVDVLRALALLELLHGARHLLLLLLHLRHLHLVDRRLSKHLLQLLHAPLLELDLLGQRLERALLEAVDLALERLERLARVLRARRALGALRVQPLHHPGQPRLCLQQLRLLVLQPVLQLHLLVLLQPQLVRRLEHLLEALVVGELRLQVLDFLLEHALVLLHLHDRLLDLVGRDEL